MRSASRPILAAVLALAAAGAAGCSAKYYKKQADKEVYGLVRKKMTRMTGGESRFTIDHPEQDPLAGVRGQAKAADETVPKARPKRMLITLREALDIAAHNNREYRGQEEALYLEGLALTLERFRWTPQLALDLAGAWSSEGHTGDAKSEQLSASSAFTLEQVLITGGRLSASFANDALRFMTGGASPTAASSLVLGVVQPLWKGAGALVARENLTQAERNMVYAIREFLRYQQGFCVKVAADYYRLLQQKDVVANEKNNHLNLVRSRKRAELMSQAGRLPEFQVSEQRQDELRALNRWISAREAFRNLQDRFRITLGLPTDSPVDPDPKDLETIREQGLTQPPIALEKAIERALKRRLDLLTIRDRVADAVRKVKIAENGLGMQIDVSGQMSFTSDQEGVLSRYRYDQRGYQLGIDLDVPLQRTEERNAYVRAVITLRQKKRLVTGSRDNIKLEVRTAWRGLSEAAQTYRIQKLSVELARQRATGTELLLRAGRATSRDYLDAQEAFVQAQNALVRAIMNHHIARLEFYRDIQMLEVNEKGMWKELIHARPAKADRKPSA